MKSKSKKTTKKVQKELKLPKKINLAMVTFEKQPEPNYEDETTVDYSAVNGFSNLQFTVSPKTKEIVIFVSPYEGSMSKSMAKFLKVPKANPQKKVRMDLQEGEAYEKAVLRHAKLLERELKNRFPGFDVN